MKKIESKIGIAALLMALGACASNVGDADDSERPYDDDVELEGLQQELSSVGTVAAFAWSYAWETTFDASNALHTHSYQGVEFCNEALVRPLVQKMSLTTGVVTTLVQSTNLCTVAAKSPRSDGTRIFYIRSSGASSVIRAVTLAAPAVDNLVVAESATSLMVDGTNLYWTTGSLRKRAKSGGVITTLFTPPASTSVRVLGLDANTVYFDQFTGSGSSQVHSIRRVAIAGGGLATVRTLAPGRQITGFTLDSNNVYWADRSWGNTLNGAVHRIAKSGVSLSDIATVAGRDVHDLAVTSAKVYWVEQLGFDSRDASIVRSRTSPTGPTGSFVNETESIPGIGSSSEIRINDARLFFQSFPWTGPLPVMRGTL